MVKQASSGCDAVNMLSHMHLEDRHSTFKSDSCKKAKNVEK